MIDGRPMLRSTLVLAVRLQLLDWRVGRDAPAQKMAENQTAAMAHAGGEQGVVVGEIITTGVTDRVEPSRGLPSSAFFTCRFAIHVDPTCDDQKPSSHRRGIERSDFYGEETLRVLAKVFVSALIH